MSDRTINFGESETEATYQIQDTDSTGGGNFVVAKDTNANTVLLQYDPDTDTWEYAGDVDMNGGNVSGVGTLAAESVNTEDVDAESVNTDIIDITRKATAFTKDDDSDVTVESDTVTQLPLTNDRVDGLGSADLNNDKAVIQDDGTYLLSTKVTWASSSNWSAGDRCGMAVNAAGTRLGTFRQRKVSTNEQEITSLTDIRSLSEGDDVFLELFQDSGSAQDIRVGTAGVRNNLLIVRLG